MSEFEAQGISFQIDHYEPVSAQPSLECSYDNLIYSCEECNSLKSDLTPPEAARKDGYIFFRPDKHIWEEHFCPSFVRLGHLSKIGEFTIEYLDLNRLSLRRLRELRKRILECEDFVSQGIGALRRFRIDQLPPTIRSRAHSLIEKIGDGAVQMQCKLDDILREGAKSQLLDVDPERASRLAERGTKLGIAKGLYPDAWRGREIRQRSKDSSGSTAGTN